MSEEHLELDTIMSLLDDIFQLQRELYVIKFEITQSDALLKYVIEKLAFKKGKLQERVNLLKNK